MQAERTVRRGLLRNHTPPRRAALEPLEPRTLLAVSINVPAGPITKITVGTDGAMQVNNAAFSSGQFFPSSGAPADGGIAVREQPSGAVASSVAAFAGQSLRPIAQVLAQDGLSITTVMDNGNVSNSPYQYQITQIVSYNPGDEFFKVSNVIANQGSAAVTLDFFTGADLYLADNDRGVGFYNPATGAIGGTDRTGQYNIFFQPSPDGLPASHYEEDSYAAVLNTPIASPTAHLTDTVRLPTRPVPYDVNLDPNYIDNGAALEWQNVTIQPGHSVLISYYDAFGNITNIQQAPAVDTSFGAGGKAQLGFLAEHTAAQPDGKLLLAGHLGSVASSNSQAVLARLNPDGTLDTTFGTAGQVLTPANQNVAGYGVAVQGDGKIVLAGEQANDFYLARFNPDGTPDATFGASGIVKTDFSAGSSDRAYTVAVQPDGHILAVGQSAGDFAAARYNPDGSLDPTFGIGGIITYDAGSPNDAAGTLSLGPAGKIAVAGVTNPDATGLGKYALTVLLPNGAKDSTWAPALNNVWTNPAANSDRTAGATYGPDGRIVAGGFSASNDFLVWKFTPTADFDPAFAGGTFATTDMGGIDDVDAIAIEPGGDVLAVGTSSTASSDSTAVAAYTPAGALNPAFGTGGKLTLAESITRAILQPAFLVATASTLAPDGRVLVATQLQSQTTPPTTVVRRLRLADTQGPVASLTSAPTLTDPASSYSFTVTYADDQSVRASTINASDVLVVAPGGAVLPVTLAGVDSPGDGSPRTATYTLVSPNAAGFSTADNGVYSVVLQPSQVTDTSDNPAVPVSPTPLGTFTVNVSTNPRVPLGTFGKVGKKNQKFTAQDPAGVPVTFSLSGNGAGTVFNDNGRLDVDVTSPASSLKISSAGVAILDDIHLLAPVKTISAKTVTLTGTLSGVFSTVQLGAVNGGTVASPILSSFQAASLNSARVLAGANLGADGKLGSNDDAFAPATLKTVKVAGAAAGSVIAAGLNPGDSLVLNGDDVLLPGGSIRSFQAGSLDDASTVLAALLPKTAKVGRQKVTAATDPRFKSTLP